MIVLALPRGAICSQGASVEVNFGRQPFQYDWTVLVAREQAAQEEALHRWGAAWAGGHCVVSTGVAQG